MISIGARRLSRAVDRYAAADLWEKDLCEKDLWEKTSCHLGKERLELRRWKTRAGSKDVRHVVFDRGI